MGCSAAEAPLTLGSHQRGSVTGEGPLSRTQAGLQPLAAQVDLSLQNSGNPFSGLSHFSLAVAPHCALFPTDSVPEHWSPAGLAQSLVATHPDTWLTDLGGQA